jgi:hypothetical protein
LREVANLSDGFLTLHGLLTKKELLKHPMVFPSSIKEPGRLNEPEMLVINLREFLRFRPLIPSCIHQHFGCEEAEDKKSQFSPRLIGDAEEGRVIVFFYVQVDGRPNTQRSRDEAALKNVRRPPKSRIRCPGDGVGRVSEDVEEHCS